MRSFFRFLRGALTIVGFGVVLACFACALAALLDGRWLVCLYWSYGCITTFFLLWGAANAATAPERERELLNEELLEESITRQLGIH